MIKKILGIGIFVVLVFVLGIFLENKIRENFNFKKVEVVDEVEVINNKETAKVLRVIDGDTIELTDKRRVRYIGMNAPEMTDKRAEVLCYAQMAKVENKKLVEGKTIEMEKDISNKDKYDRLLRYIWVDGQMINLVLVQNGFAKTATYPPDVKYKDLFLTAEKTANKIICSKI